MASLFMAVAAAYTLIATKRMMLHTSRLLHLMGGMHVQTMDAGQIHPPFRNAGTGS